MQSIWKDTMHLTYGDGGRNPLNDSSNLIYSGVPYSGTGWALTPPGNGIPNDHRLLLGSGPFSLASGDTATIDFAYIFTWDSLNPNGLNTSFARNVADLDRVQYWFDTNSFPSCEVYTTGLGQVKINLYSIYPNPATTQLHILKANVPVNGINYTVYDLLGAMVMKGRVYNGSLNIKHLRDQVYILKLEREKGNEFFRFVKM